MWCANCRSDVAAEVSSDNRHVNCANCGGPIATPLAGRTLSRTQQARELLERWSLDRKTETAAAPDGCAAAPSWAATPDGCAAAAPSWAAAKSESHSGKEQSVAVYSIKPDHSAADTAEHGQSRRTGSEPPRPHLQVDGSEKADRSHSRPETAEREVSTSRRIDRSPSSEGPPSNRPARYRRDAAHAVTGPHAGFAAKPPTKWVPLVGQGLAYVGVLALMAGACLVILGYFRGPANYAPTGWLITMAGQMLLFLGVVTLVSTGMEETTNTVASRIDRLDEKLLRIEQATSRLRGPNGGTDGYAPGAAPDASAALRPSRNAATSETVAPQQEIARVG